MKKIKAVQLQLTDRIIPNPDRSPRAYAIDAIQRVRGRYPIEVWTRGKGTMHFAVDDTVYIADPS